MSRGGWYALLLGSLHLYTQWNVLVCILVADITVITVWNVPIYYFVKWRRDKTAEKRNKTIQITKVVSSSSTGNDVEEKIDMPVSDVKMK